MDKYGNTPLHIAAKYGHELLISTLMTNGADTARYARHWGFPRAFQGDRCCCSDVSNAFIFICFSVSRRGIHGMFPLHLAVLYGFSDCCRKLLSSGLYSSTVRLY